MNNQLIHKLEERLLPLIKRIERLEQGTNIQGIDAIEQHNAETDVITSEIEALAELAIQAGDAFSRKVEKKLTSLFLRMQLLPQVPRMEVIRLAQSMLTVKPLLLMTDEIKDAETGQPELTRIFLMEPTEVPRFDYSFAPSWNGNIHILELDTTEKTADATTPPPTSLEIAWSQFHNAIYGRSILAFDLPLAQIQLGVTARIHGLPVPMLIGHSMLDLLLMYVGIKGPIFHEMGGPRLELTDTELCDLMERDDVLPFYDSLLAPADQRARHLLYTLQKMAEGTLTLQEPHSGPTVRTLDPFF